MWIIHNTRDLFVVLYITFWWSSTMVYNGICLRSAHKKGHVMYECDLIDKMICVVFDPNNVTWTLGIILNM